MPVLTFSHLPANLDALDHTLRTALPAVLIGVSRTPEALHVYLADTALPDQLAQARTLVLAHDPAAYSPRQQAEQTRRGVLAQLRAENAANTLDLSGYDALPAAEKAAFVRRLVQKVVWLEKEIHNLTQP